MAPGVRQSALVLLFGAGYFVCVLAGHALSIQQLEFATFWPAAGFFLATLAVSPKRYWAQYVIVGSAVNVCLDAVWQQEPVPVSSALLFALANSLEAVVGGWILQRIANGKFHFFQIKHVLGLAAISLFTPLLGAAIGAGGLANWSDTTQFMHFFQLWWQADSVGILLVAPVFIAVAARVTGLEPAPSPTPLWRYVEAVLLLIALNVVAWLAFSPFANSLVWSLLGMIYVVPLLAWAGLRYCRLGAAIASSMTVMITLYHTTRGDGLFAMASDVPEMQVMSLQSFALITMLTPLLFATVIDNRRVAEDKMRYNLSILQSVLDNTTDLIYVKDLQGRYLLANEATAELTRRPVDEIIGRRDVEIVPPDSVDAVRQRDQLVFAAGKALTSEETAQLHGRKYTFLTTKSPYRNSAGEIIGLVGLSRDITQLVAQVDALAESERRYRTLVTSSSVGIYETDAEGNCSYLNPRWCELTGRPAHAGLGQGWMQCLHPDDRQTVFEAFQDATNSGREFRLQYRYLKPDGGINWVLGTAVPLYDAEHQVTGYLGNVIDISDQKRALIDLQASEERFRRVADSAPVLIWTATINGQFTYCNRGWLEFTGRTLDKELNHGWLDNIHADDRERCQRMYAEAALTRSPFELDYRLRRNDGEYRWIHHASSPKVMPSGEFRGFIGSCFDVTDQRRATETLLRAKEELEQHVADRTAELRKANEQLQQLLIERAQADEIQQQQQAQLAHVSRLSVMGEMAAGLAHELNQPLFAIQNYTAGILRRWTGPEDCSPALREIIQQIALESTRAAVIIRRVREFARKQVGERSLLSLNTIIEEVLQLLSSEIRQHRVELKLSLADQLSPALIDRVQLQQVMVNLIHNALEAMDSRPPRQRRLTIRTALEASEIHCVVEDTGLGISPDVRQRLFEPFFTTKLAGLGMGLSISRSIIEAHGGQMTAEPLSTGASFHFSIPLIEDQLDVAAALHADRVFGG